MLLLLLGRHATWTSRTSNPIRTSLKSYSTKSSKPLRILFCGSDAFSTASLQALHHEQMRNPSSIASIDVLCRPGKKSGRGMRSIRPVPVQTAAQALGLPVHERDTFTGWELPKPNGEPINLIIAVSFGLFVPPRILRSAEYGGLNVHPSILPAFRGPAPIQHFLLSDATSTGVSLQTLDEKSFDHGIVLARSDEIKREPDASYADVLSCVTQEAATLLARGIRDRLFESPPVEIDPPPMPDTIKNLHAPKIVPSDKCIDWTWSAESFARRYLALGSLWSMVPYPLRKPKRWIFDTVEAIQISDIASQLQRHTNDDRSSSPDASVLWRASPGGNEGMLVPSCKLSDSSIVFQTGSNEGVRVAGITVEGEKNRPAAIVLGEYLEQWDLNK
ncbi:formyl transferase [Phlyctema vagabunda]|uniref:methionyl-tRNA formyltransferase n=1 Tax=Phlyctema vagabunda TaxID=108571 RepID=A0ABR4PLX8_9HELO